MRKAQPDTMATFSQMAKSATATGELDAKTKALQRLGVSRGELAETLAMSVYMRGGGPPLMYAADALKAYDEFSNYPVVLPAKTT